MTEPSQKPSDKLREQCANSKRMTFREPDPNAPVRIVVGGRPAKKENPAKEKQ